jgi:hypothetical protein
VSVNVAGAEKLLDAGKAPDFGEHIPDVL